MLRFFIGGTLVSVLTLVADMLKPKDFARLFGAALSIALATLTITIQTEGIEKLPERRVP